MRPSTLELERCNTSALGHLLALLGETLVLLASGCALLLDLLQTGGRLWGAAWAAPLRHRVPPLGLLLRLLKSASSMASATLTVIEAKIFQLSCFTAPDCGAAARCS